jgi:TolB-like protein/Flp pilus assembly protein TadD
VEKPFSAYRGDDTYVFVSYVHSDADIVYPELARLHEAGFNIWYDEGISPGTVWREELARAIESCSTFLVFVSPGVNDSDHVMKEVNFALDCDCTVLAVHLKEVDLAPGLRLSLSDRQAILKYDRSEDDYRAALHAALGETAPATREPRPPATRKRGRRPMLAAAAAAIVMGIGWLTLEQVGKSVSEPTTAPFAERPAIAVLPFVNLGGNPEDDYFIDGLAEDLIDRLASYRSFPVIGWFSSIGYRDLEKDPLEVANELGARYLVRGSAQRSAETIRVNVRLYDAESSMQIWSDRYDRSLEHVLDVQDEIGSAVVSQMYPQLDDFDRHRALRRAPSDMTAWDHAQKGWWHFVKGSPGDNRASQQAHAQALQHDPSYANAAAGLAMAHYQSIGFGWTENPEDSIQQLVEAAERAVVLDSHDPLSQHALGHAYALTGNREGMIEAFTTSLELNPSSALVQICTGEGLAMAGESEAAIVHLEKAIRLSPKDPGMHWIYHGLALAYFGDENYDEAVTWARLAVSHHPEFAFGLRTLATSLAQAGRTEEAHKVLLRARALEPDFTLAGGRRVLLTALPTFAERYMDGLRKAGLS